MDKKKKLLSLLLASASALTMTQSVLAQSRNTFVDYIEANALSMQGRLYPTRTNGDCETGKNPLMDASATLRRTRGGRQIYVDFHYKAYEYDHDQSTAEAIDSVLLYTAPEGYRVSRILGDRSWSVAEIAHTSRNTPLEIDPGPTSPWFFKLQARTLGTDFVDCGPPPHSYMELVNKGSMQIEVEIERF